LLYLFTEPTSAVQFSLNLFAYHELILLFPSHSQQSENLASILVSLVFVIWCDFVCFGASTGASH
jgi:hypothetical protein